MQTPPPIITEMMNAALKAAHMALLRRKEGVMRGRKPDQSWITNGDYQTQQVIEAELHGIAQAHRLEGVRFLMEEQLGGPEPDFAGRGRGYHWVVDPIDGTAGYARMPGEKADPWAISIALEKDGKPVAAVIYEAARQEYGNMPADREAMQPGHPQGTLYWAAAEAPDAHQVTGDFTVSAAPGTDYAQTPVDPGRPDSFRKLRAVPALSVNCRRVRDSIIARDTPIAQNALSRIDSMQYGLPDTGSQTPHHKALCEACGFHAANCAGSSTIVCAALGVAKGSVSACLSSNGGYPWDHSAIRLILEKSGVPVTEYRTGDESTGRRTLIASRDEELFAAMSRTVACLRNARRQPVVTVIDPQEPHRSPPGPGR